MNRFDSLGCPVHDIILQSGGVICEDMTGIGETIACQETGRLFAAPARVEMASFTTRVFVLCA